MREELLLLANPASGSGAGARTLPRLEVALRDAGIPHRTWVTEAAGDGFRLGRRAAEEGVQRVLCVGGDGTIHEVVNGLLAAGGQLPEVGVMPLGTGNDFYRIVGAPKDIAGVIGVLRHGQVRRVDVGRVSWDGQERFFVNLMGVGLDVEVLLRRERVRWLSGMAQYLAALATAIVRYRPIEVEVEVEDAEPIREPTMLSAVTVGPSVGGGFMLNPTAEADDGFLDLCFIRRLSLLQVLRYVPRVIRGSHEGLDGFHFRRFKRARFAAKGGRPLPFELDGELMPASSTPIEISVLPGALGVLVPGPGVSK